MLKFLTMCLMLISMPACQSRLGVQKKDNVRIQISSESNVNLANQITPFTASKVTGVQAETLHGFKIDASHITLPSHLRVSSPIAADRPVSISDVDNGFSLPGVLSLQWNWNRGSISVGRQTLDTPYIQTDDALLNPNLFESAAATFEIGDYFDLSVFYVDNVSEWDFGAENITYKSFGSSLGVRNTEAAAIIAAKFANDRFNGQAWFYHIPDIENVGYFELSHTGKITEGIAYQLSSQVEWARGEGSALLGDIGSTTFGISTGVNWSDFSVFAAYNQLIVGSSTAIGIGGDPYYTSLEYRSFADIASSDGYAVAGGFSYQPADTPLKIELAAARFKGGGQSDFDVREIDLSVSYDLPKDINLSMFFSSMSGQGAESDDHRFAFSLQVPF